MKVRVVKNYLIEVDYAEYSRLTRALSEYCKQYPAASDGNEVRQLRDILYGSVWGWGGCPSDCTSKVHDHPPAREARV